MTFTEKVFAVVSKIPRGSVMTYAEVAKAAGKPRAYRAVGNILNQNPHPFRLRSEHPLPKGEGIRLISSPRGRGRGEGIVIPCHRVVKSDGKVGGYVGGAAKKMRLLQKEGLTIKNHKVV